MEGRKAFVEYQYQGKEFKSSLLEQTGGPAMAFGRVCHSYRFHSGTLSLR